MLLKVTSISWIVFIVLYLVLKAMSISMSEKEKINYEFYDKLPTRCTVVTLLLLLSFLESLTVSIITIVKW